MTEGYEAPCDPSQRFQKFTNSGRLSHEPALFILSTRIQPVPGWNTPLTFQSRSSSRFFLAACYRLLSSLFFTILWFLERVSSKFSYIMQTPRFTSDQPLFPRFYLTRHLLLLLFLPGRRFRYSLSILFTKRRHVFLTLFRANRSYFTANEFLAVWPLDRTNFDCWLGSNFIRLRIRFSRCMCVNFILIN